MFLKTLDLYGFKSFADRTHIDFAAGITTLLGPNGCGKSNIVDSIKWVLGEQGTKTLRASRMEDVIFNGNDKRKPMPFCEVTLVIDNENGFLRHPAAEIEVKRRIYRAGGNEYFINREKCRLRDIKDLFLDTGVGKSAYSILEQGKIDQIISMKPEDRRSIFEEAAGISRFKVECNEAQNKIERTNENIVISENYMREAKRTYDRTRSQAEKARAFRELEKRTFELEVDLNIAKIKTLLATKSMREQRIVALGEKKTELSCRLESFSSDIDNEVESIQGRTEEVSRLRIKANSINEKISALRQTIGYLENRFRELSEQESKERARGAQIKSSIDRDKAQLEEQKDQNDRDEELLAEKKNQIAVALKMQDQTSGIIKRNEEEIKEKEKRSEELDTELVELSEELKKVIDLLISEVDENTSGEYSVERKSKAETMVLRKLSSGRDKLSERLAYIDSLSGDTIAKSIAKEDFSSMLSLIEEISKLFAEYRDSIPPVVDLLLSPEGVMSRKRSIEQREKAARVELEAAKDFIVRTRAANEGLNSDILALKETVSAIQVEEAKIASDVANRRIMIASLQKNIEERSYEYEDSIVIAEAYRNQLNSANKDIADKDNEIRSFQIELKNTQDEADEMDRSLSDLQRELSRKRNEKEKLQMDILNADRDIESEKLWISNTDDSVQQIYETFFQTYSRPLNEFKERFDEEQEQMLIENELRDIQKKKASFGNINYMAEEEFSEAEKNYQFYDKQLNDLYKAKNDLEKVLAEIQSQSEKLFLDTYKQISANFQDMFKRLFGGGNAHISLENEDEILTSGIEITAQPPGKKPSSLNLLSGGERSMTAVALLFATYMVKPSPFCILDEIDAALDDRNIGYFLSVLEDFSKTSQFIIITHNKHTVTASESLLGVTQMEAGVSTTVSYKIRSVKGEPVILDENEKLVEIE